MIRSLDLFSTGRQNERAIFTLRMLKYLFCWLMLWQDSMIGGSIFEFSTFTGVIPGIRPVELMALIAVLFGLAERTPKRDFTVRRSYFSAPLIAIVFIFVLSWVRGSIMKQAVVGILEGKEAFAWPFAFFAISNTFRDPEDREVLWMLVISAVIPKALEGVYIYYFIDSPGVSWGVVQLWRDAYLLGIGAVSLMLFPHYHGKKLRNVKRLLFLSTPVLGFTFLMSFRRTFLLSALVSMMLMFITLPKGLRTKQFRIAGLFIGFLLLFALITNPLAIAERLGSVFAPKAEGSAYIRLLEWPNVIENIKNNPLFGVPVGIPWKTYWRMPVSAVYTTLGTHNTYLYWALRGGFPGLIVFLWLLGKLWKTALINNALRRTEEDFMFGQLCIHLLILYCVSCFFGLMYSEDLPVFMGALITLYQLQTKYICGRYSLKEVSLLRTLRNRTLTFKERYQPSATPVIALEGAVA